MKLKKIASLALAGVMAISMLAGCGDNSSNTGNTDNKDEGTTTVSSASTTFYNELAKETRQRITKATGNSTLDAALQKAVETYISNGDVFEIATTPSGVVNANNSTDGAQKVLSEVADALDAKDTIGDNFKSTKEDTSCVVVYVVDGGVSDTYAVELAAAKLDSALSDNSCEKIPVTGSNGKDYEYDYSISASVATRSYKALGSELSVKFVAVVIDQTVTEA